MAEVTNITTSLGNMVSQVYFLISEKQGSSIFQRTNIVDALNDCFSRIARRSWHNEEDIYTTLSAGVRSVEVPDAMSQFGNIIIDKVYIDGDEIEATVVGIDEGETGTPSEWFVVGNSIYLYPTADVDYELRIIYHREFAPLVEDTDETSMPDVAIDAAIRYACYLMKLKDEEYAAADRFKQEYDEYFREATSAQTGVYKASSRYSYGGAV